SSAPGKGVGVAVIDTGVDYNHKDLADNIWTNPDETPDNGVDDDGNGYVDDIHGINAISYNGDPMDDHGHGTHVAGDIAMTAGNGGGIGLAYGAKIMCIKAGSADGNFASNDIARAIKYAADNGADVINMSFGGEEKSTLVETALKDAAKDAVLVASAGNDGLPTSEAAANGYKNCKDVYPAGYNCVIGVMASDNNDKLASFSNWDYISGKGCEYEMAAPGTEIYSTLPDNRYAVWNGTSLSASCVSAAAAIIRSEYPNKNKYDARYIMGQLINASSSKATAEPAVVTTPVITESATTTVANPVTTVSTTTVISDDPLVNADADGSGGIDKSDFTAILKGMVGLNDLGGSKGDVNCDGSADMFDAVSVLRLCDSKDNLSAIMDSATIRKEYVTFDIPSIDITENGDYKNYKFTYNADYPFKAVTGQLKYNGKAYSGEFKEIKLLDSTSGDIIYEFNPENGKVAAYSASNETSGSFTISLYEGKDGAYTIDPSSLKFYDENGKEYLGYSLGMFDPVLNIKSAALSVAAVGTPTAVAVYDKKVEYPRLNIMDSLTVKPHPDLRIDAVEMLETADIFDSNNGDGIVQPGETVGLGISLWNGWGAASDVNVKIEAIGADGKANPYVEVLDSSIDFGNIATLSGADNGLTYSDGKVKSISTPVRIKVKDDVPNDGKMTFKITVTAKNGFETEDTEDTEVYTEYSFIVQRIKLLSGKIKKDIILDKSFCG
uniref:S8 family serine peptidase n=1 Tax=Ruminococcus sp. TaxID=41978 RepID=UPI0025EC939B